MKKAFEDFIILVIASLIALSIVLSISYFIFRASGRADGKTIKEIQQTLDQNDSQVIIALGNNFEAKEGLIKSSELNGDGLIALCTKPEPMNIDNSNIKNYFKKAIARTKLTPQQQVQIAKIGDSTYSKTLLLSNDLSAEALVEICKNTKVFNLNNTTVQGWFRDAINRTNLTAKQQVQIAEIGRPIYKEALLLSNNLSAEGLIAVCENPRGLNLNNPTVQKWFKNAIQRTELTEAQKVKIAKSKIQGLGLF